MGTNYYLVKTKPTLTTPLHIGKRSGGWKFLFHEVSLWDTDWCVELHTYQDWKNYLWKEIVDNNEAVILNEYEKEISLTDFFNIVREAQEEDNPDDFTWSRYVDGYRFTKGEFC